MKSFIFCTSSVNNQSDHHHISRYQRWMDFYRLQLKELDADRIFLIDDGGTDYQKNYSCLEGKLPADLVSDLNFYRFENKMGRDSLIQFPGWWRSFLFSIDIARKYGYKKIIHIESDFFLLSEELKSFIASANSGWISLYSNFYDLPETAVQIICEDQFENFDKLRAKILKTEFIVDDYAESIIPFTRVEKKFTGDRFGEEQVLAWWVDTRPGLLSKLDYFGQMVFPPSVKVCSIANELDEIAR
jgi:hypothetical protein